jgi:leucyl-tRNA synthetase
LDRVEKFIEELDIKSLPEQSLLDLKKVQRDYDAGFNYKKIALHVCVARLIEMLNLFKKEQSKIAVQDLKQLLANLYPFSATFAEEIWNQIQDKRGIPNGKRVLLSSSTLTSLGFGNSNFRSCKYLQNSY